MAGTMKDYLGYGTFAARPVSPAITAVSGASAHYFATDTATLYAWTGAAWVAVASGGSTGLYSAYLMYQDQKTNGTAGGTFTSGGWQTRTLTTEVADTGNHGTLNANQINTLDAGTYRVQAICPAWAVDRHQCRLQNITDSTTLVLGLNGIANAAAPTVSTPATLTGRFTIASAKIIELQHRCQTTEATDGFGAAMSFGSTEVYATLELWKE